MIFGAPDVERARRADRLFRSPSQRSRAMMGPFKHRRTARRAAGGRWARARRSHISSDALLGGRWMTVCRFRRDVARRRKTACVCRAAPRLRVRRAVEVRCVDGPVPIARAMFELARANYSTIGGDRSEAGMTLALICATSETTRLLKGEAEWLGPLLFTGLLEVVWAFSMKQSQGSRDPACQPSQS
ncbi:hypothetical protein DO73_4627 [Burkholderia pseudomallei]|nr:hypothetical protein DO73_4627 [Burkholderia pseudomallei]